MSELLTVQEVAAIVKCSEDAVVRRFAKVDGVIDLGRAERKDKRQYRVLRIPKSVLEKYLSTKAGHPVRVEVPDRPPRSKGKDWRKRAIKNLAKAALQNNDTDRKVLERIGQLARMFTQIPENLWTETLDSLPDGKLSWYEEEDE